MLEQLTSEHFAPHLHQLFKLGSDQQTFEAELVEVSTLSFERPAVPGAERAQAFSIVFAGPQDPVQSQGICSIQHPELGELQVFLVPIGPGGNGMMYEAIFA